MHFQKFKNGVTEFVEKIKAAYNAKLVAIFLKTSKVWKFNLFVITL
jgi:hypothetical protein